MKTLFILFMLMLIAGCGQMPMVAGGVSDFQMSTDGSLKVKNTKEYAEIEAWMEVPGGQKKYYYKAKGV